MKNDKYISVLLFTIILLFLQVSCFSPNSIHVVSVELSENTKPEHTHRIQKVDSFVYKTYLYYYEPEKLLPATFNDIPTEDDSLYSEDYNDMNKLVFAPVVFNPIMMFGNSQISFGGDKIYFKATFILNTTDSNLIKEIGKVEFRESNKYQIQFLLSELIKISKLPIVDSIDHKIQLLLQINDMSN